MSEKQDFVARFDVSRETLGRLDAFAAELSKWNKTINLVSPSTLPNLWSRHFADSAQIFALAPPNARRWADLGSGGGFPGLIVAILAAEKAPGLAVTLVESDLRKAAFLASASRACGVLTTILSQRIEKTAPLEADVVSARALAPLDRLLDLAARHLSPEGVCLFPKGARWADEMRLARKRWGFTDSAQPSITDPEAVVLKLEKVTHV